MTRQLSVVVHGLAGWAICGATVVMFTSILGTWVPFASIFAASYFSPAVC